MKIDIDSYLYIVITIIILIITALGRRKKKTAQQVPGQQAGEPATVTDEQEQGDPYEGATIEQVMSDPLERLERMFAPKETTFMVQEEEPEPDESKMDAEAEERRIKQMEEERTKRSREEKQAEMAEAFRLHSEGDLTSGENAIGESKIFLNTLFDDPNDLTKAIIYSEIFNRKEF